MMNSDFIIHQMEVKYFRLIKVFGMLMVFILIEKEKISMEDIIMTFGNLFQVKVGMLLINAMKTI